MKIKVTTPNRMLIINNVPVRTPCEIDVKNKIDLEYMKSYLRTESAEYEIIDNQSKVVPETIIRTTKKIPVEEPTIKEEPIDEETIKAVDEIVQEDEEPVIEELGDVKESGRILDEILSNK